MSSIKVNIWTTLKLLICKITGFLRELKPKWLVLLRTSTCHRSDDLKSHENTILENEKSSPSYHTPPRAMPEHVCTPSGKENLEAILKYLFSHGIQFRFTREHHEYPRLHLRCSPQQFRIFESNMADYLLPADRIPIPRHIRRKLETRSFCAMTSKAKKCSRKHYCRHIPKTPYDFRPTTSGPNKPNQPRKNNKKSQRMPVNPGSSRFAVRKAG